MDVSNTGAANSAQYLQRATSGLQAPMTPIKQEEQAAQVLSQVLPQASQQVQQQQQQQQQQARTPTVEDLAKSGVGSTLDILA